MSQKSLAQVWFFIISQSLASATAATTTSISWLSGTSLWWFWTIGTILTLSTAFNDNNVFCLARFRTRILQDFHHVHSFYDFAKDDVLKNNSQFSIGPFNSFEFSKSLWIGNFWLILTNFWKTKIQNKISEKKFVKSLLFWPLTVITDCAGSS